MTQNKSEKKKVIGITGGVGSGKSYVVSFIKAHFPVTVIQADEVGRELMEPGKSVYQALVRHYRNEILCEDGSINRPHLSAIAFKDEASQKEINEIEHPIIYDEITARTTGAEHNVVFIEAALLKEGKLDEICDEIWFVYVDPETRITRLMESRGYSREKCMAIMDRQFSDEAFLSYATLKIDNSGTVDETEAAVIKEMERIGVPQDAL